MVKIIFFGLFCLLTPNLVTGFLPRLPVSLRLKNKFHAEDGGRIVGGIPAKAGEIPYQVSLQVRSAISGVYHHFCGGSLISEICVITAAHCAEGRHPEKLFVVAGVTSLNSSTPLAVRDIQVNKDYNPGNVTNDIAIIKLAEPVEFSANLKPIGLPKDHLQTPPGTLTTVAGFGTTAESGPLSENLLYTEVPIVEDEECQSKYGKAEIAHSMICAGSDKGGKDSCQGDSGGPLASGSGKEAILIGIVSWGFGCARPEYPGVYTEVCYFLEFINSHGCF